MHGDWNDNFDLHLKCFLGLFELGDMYYHLVKALSL